MRLGGVQIPVSEEVDEFDRGNVGVTYIGSLGRVSCLRPARFVTKYSHARPRFMQRPQVGFSLLHFTLEVAQAWQLSRSLRAAGIAERRADAECTAAMVDCWYGKTADRLR